MNDPEPTSPVDVSILPPELDAFVREFEDLAEGDDVRRSELVAGLDKARIARLSEAADPLFPAINSYLDALSASGRPWPDDAITLSQLGELAAELLVEPEVESEE